MVMDDLVRRIIEILHERKDHVLAFTQWSQCVLWKIYLVYLIHSELWLIKVCVFVCVGVGYLV